MSEDLEACVRGCWRWSTRPRPFLQATGRTLPSARRTSSLWPEFRTVAAIFLSSSRSAASNEADLELIGRCTDLAVDCALAGKTGVIGQDEENGDTLTNIAFDRIKGGKPFDTTQPWFTAMLSEIGQA